MTTELLGEASGELLALLLLITVIAFCLMLMTKVVIKTRHPSWGSGGQTPCTEVSPLGYSPLWSHKERAQHTGARKEKGPGITWIVITLKRFGNL